MRGGRAYVVLRMDGQVPHGDLLSVTLRRARTHLVFLCVVAPMACGDSRRLVEPLETCATPPCPVVWRPSGNPHRVNATVQLDQLVIEPGTVVEFGQAGRLELIKLEINGTEESPVQLGPATEGGRWGGIEIYFGSGAIRHAIIDGGGIVVGNGALRVEHTTIRRAAGAAIALGRRTTMYIRGGAIEDNGGSGIVTLFEFHLGSTVVFEEAVRITRNGRYPLAVPLVSLRGLMSEEDVHAMLIGNARDTLIAFAGSTWGAQNVPAGELILRKSLPVRAHVACSGPAIGPMTMLPGALLVLEGGQCSPPIPGRVLPTMAGTAEEPATMYGNNLTFGVEAGDTARVVHARLHNVFVWSTTTPVAIEDSELDHVTLRLEAPGSRLLRVRSVRGGGPALPQYNFGTFPAITLGSHGRIEHTIVEDARYDAVIVTGDDVVISDCTIRGSAGHGVRVEQGSARVEHCNLEANTGDGVHNVTTNIIDARYNWWGDGAGPLGGNGDGVSANVLYEPYATAPLTHLSFARRPAAPPPRRPVVP
jgi:hypothetical protein